MLRRLLMAGLGLVLFACGGSSDTSSGGGGSAGKTGGAGGSSGGSGGAKGGTGGTTGGTGGATGGSAGTGATGGSAGSGGASGGSAGATGGAAGSTGCTGCGVGNPGFICCGDQCVNPNNDIKNCGKCGTTCTGDHPFCSGKCGTPPCEGTSCSNATFCCGSTCCNTGELCCDVPGPIESGPKCTPPTAQGTCPTGCTGCVCNSPDTPIATPFGQRPIAELKVGDLVYSLDRGKIRSVTIRAVNRVPTDHHVVVELELASGTVLHISPAHPTADGRTFGALKSGDYLDGVRVTRTRLIPYTHDATYDILPDTESGVYFAGGVLIGSTLQPTRALASSVSSPFTSVK